MKRNEVTVAALTNAGWQGPLGKMVSAVHKNATIRCGQSADHDFRHAVIADEVVVSIYRPRQKTFTICNASTTKRESFRKTCRSDCE